MARRLYGMPQIQERHRHKYEFNNEYMETFAKLGMVFSGANQEYNLAEIIEYNDHPFFMACSFHPEFNSRPYRAHPLFVGLINGCITVAKKSTIYND